VTETFGNLVSLLFLGFLLGIRHAIDPTTSSPSPPS